MLYVIENAAHQLYSDDGWGTNGSIYEDANFVLPKGGRVVILLCKREHRCPNTAQNIRINRHINMPILDCGEHE